MSIHPIDTTQKVRDAYLRYLKTIKPFQDEKLRAEFANAIEKHEMLVKGPLVEISQPYKHDDEHKDIKDLVDTMLRIIKEKAEIGRSTVDTQIWDQEVAAELRMLGYVIDHTNDVDDSEVTIKW